MIVVSVPHLSLKDLKLYCIYIHDNHLRVEKRLGRSFCNFIGLEELLECVLPVRHPIDISV